MITVADRLHEHVAQVALEHGITIEHRGRGMAYRGGGERRVTITPVRGRSSYFVAMHELGHILGRQPRRVLEREVAAWQWALEHALEPPTPAVARMIARCLRSYRARAERGIWGTVLPDGFDDFLAWVDALT